MKSINKKGQVLQSVWITMTLIAGLFILSITLLVIFSSLKESLPPETAGVSNETGAYLNSSGYVVSNASVVGFSNPGISEARNGTADGSVIAPGNYTIDSTGRVTNASAVVWLNVQLDYSYNFDGVDRLGVNTASNQFIAILPMSGVLLLIIILGAVIGIVMISLMFKSKRRA